MKWLMGKKSHLSIENKLLIYKVVIQPIWSYGIELWGCASKTNIVIMQRSPIHNSQSHIKCTMLCNKSFSTYRLKQLLRN